MLSCVDISYRFVAVKMVLRAMSASSKVSMRTDSKGVLSMNFMLEVDGKNVFVEFRVVRFELTDLDYCEC
jgi:Repair protein Rad1/Rec1/Rad17